MRQLEATATQSVYDSVLKQYEDMLAAETYSGSEIRIVSAATLPTHPNFPKKLLFTAAAAGISLALGSFACAVASVMRRRISVDFLAEALGLPILARVNVPGGPWFSFGQQARIRRAFFWQRIHEFRSTINVTDKRHPVTLITSVRPNEGKSLVASALARALASSGLRTLLIDLNGRNSRYQSSLDRRSVSPLSLQDYLDGTASAGQTALQIDRSSPLFLMTSGPNKITDIGILPGAKIKSRLAALKKEFDAIVVDSPALESLSDALQIAAYADEIVLTVLAGENPPEKFREDVGKIRSRSGQLKGVIIVDKSAPNADDLACIARDVLRDPLPEIWPKAKPAFFSTKELFNRLFGRRSKVDSPAEASV